MISNFSYMIADSIINKMRSCLKQICFQNCGFYGDYTTVFPLNYPSIEKITFWNMRFNNKGEFGKYLCLKEIYFMEECETYEFHVDNGITTEYRKINDGVTFDIIFKFINNQSEITQLKPIKIIKSDVYFNDSLKRDYPWSLLTRIGQCTLRDSQTEFTFSMIHTFLTSTVDAQNSPPVRPIDLTISKFKDGDTNMPPQMKDIQAQLRQLAKLRGLNVHKMTINNSGNNIKYILQLQLLKNQGRKLNLTIIENAVIIINNNEEVVIA
ncbi:hypothetical protein FGO68_gene5721 [Halteria grandinella]|uniref:Uncharacterized protein n=1 Tax=Halteria grandinella TaxID=5974 RepID=A0A8J8NGX1_HALGN|nr:hypothetical protein FGO68_gene5721 [Halteria grandinella]